MAVPARDPEGGEKTHGTAITMESEMKAKKGRGSALGSTTAAVFATVFAANFTFSALVRWAGSEGGGGVDGTSSKSRPSRPVPDDNGVSAWPLCRLMGPEEGGGPIPSTALYRNENKSGNGNGVQAAICSTTNRNSVFRNLLWCDDLAACVTALDRVATCRRGFALKA